MPSLPDISEGAIFFSASKKGHLTLLQSTWPAKRAQAHLANFGSVCRSNMALGT